MVAAQLAHRFHILFTAGGFSFFLCVGNPSDDKQKLR